MKCEKCGKETEMPVLVKIGAGTMFVGPDCAKRGIRSGEFRKYTQKDRISDALKTDSEFAKGYNGKHGGAAIMRLGSYKVGQLVPVPQGYSEWEKLGGYVIARHHLPYPIRISSPHDRESAMRNKRMGDFVLRIVEHEKRPHGVNWGQIVAVTPRSEMPEISLRQEMKP